MTCIVGLAQDGKVTIGGDSAAVDGFWLLDVRADTKVFQKSEFVFGFTSSFRMGQLLRHKLEPPFHKPTIDVDKYMTTEFIDAVRQCFKDGGFAVKDKEQEAGGTFLVGYRGKLYVIYSDYQVAEPKDGYFAVGSGAPVAMGALFAQAQTDRTVGEKLTTALQAAERFNAGVRAPFALVTI